MATSGVSIMVATISVAMTFAIVSAWRGPRTAFLALCWLPLASFAATYLARNQLGYTALAALGAIFASSIELALLGLRLRARAIREHAASDVLTCGTLIALAPLAILLAMWLFA